VRDKIYKGKKFTIGIFADLKHRLCCKISSKEARERILVTKGVDRIEDTLDVKSLVRLFTDVKILKRLLIPKEKLPLMRWQRQRLLEEEDSTDSHESTDSDSTQKLNISLASTDVTNIAQDRNLVYGLLERRRNI